MADLAGSFLTPLICRQTSSPMKLACRIWRSSSANLPSPGLITMPCNAFQWSIIFSQKTTHSTIIWQRTDTKAWIAWQTCTGSQCSRQSPTCPSLATQPMRSTKCPCLRDLLNRWISMHLSLTAPHSEDCRCHQISSAVHPAKWRIQSVILSKRTVKT